MIKYNEAINICLQVIGEQTLIEGEAVDGLFEAEQADFLIEQTKKELLAEGWSFNTDSSWEYTPDSNGYITITEDVLRIDPSSTSSNIIRKDGKLYDKTNQTFVFESSIECDVVWEIDFDDIPYIAQKYIANKAARILYQRLVGDTSMINILVRDEEEALLKLRLHEDDIYDYNIFDDQSVSRALSRTSNPTGIRG